MDESSIKEYAEGEWEVHELHKSLKCSRKFFLLKSREHRERLIAFILHAMNNDDELSQKFSYGTYVIQGDLLYGKYKIMIEIREISPIMLLIEMKQNEDLYKHYEIIKGPPDLGVFY